MHVKLDENLPGRLVAALQAMGHDVDTVAGEGLQGRPDPDVLAAAVAADRLLVTQDLHFGDVRRFEPGSHCGVLLVRLREPGRDVLLHRVVSVFETEPVADWPGCLIVVSARKVRVVRDRPGD